MILDQAKYLWHSLVHILEYEARVGDHYVDYIVLACDSEEMWT